MRSVTSCFNPTLYRKTMARFWPLWTAYGVLWLFLLPLGMLNRYFARLRSTGSLDKARETLLSAGEQLPNTLQPGVWIALLAGILAAMAVFGYLYNNRSAGMMHALPLRRESLFFTQYLAGASFLLLPHLAVAAVTAAAQLALLPPALWGQVLPKLGLWLLCQSSTGLFFYSFAVFCAMFTGHILALPAFYGILNLLVYGVYLLVSSLLERVFYGYPGPSGHDTLLKYLTPVWALEEASDWTRQTWLHDGTVFVSSEQRVLEAPGVVAAYGAAGLVLAGLALLVYRRRHVERAGDVVSVGAARPVFRTGVAVCTGLAFGLYTSLFFDWETPPAIAACVVVWSVVGWLAAEMLLQKSFRVWKGWPGAALHAGVMALLCAVCLLDWFGIESRVPAAEQVAGVDMYTSAGLPHDSGRLDRNDITDPNAIARITTLHRALVEQGERVQTEGDEWLYLDLIYRMKDGSTLRRCYYSVPIRQGEQQQEGTVAWAMDQILQDRALKALCYDFDRYEQLRLVEAGINGDWTGEGWKELYLSASRRELEQLWQAVRRDYDRGNIGLHYLFEEQRQAAGGLDANVFFSFADPDAPQRAEGEPPLTQTVTVALSPAAEHTMSWLADYFARSGEKAPAFLKGHNKAIN